MEIMKYTRFTSGFTPPAIRGARFPALLLRTLVSLWVSNDFHVAHSTRSSRSEHGCRAPLRRCVAVGGDHTVELFILGFIRVSAYWSGFGAIGQISILSTVTSNGIPMATPQKHKDFQRF